MATIQDAINRLQTVCDGLTGIKGVANYLPDQLPNTSISGVIYVGAGRIQFGASGIRKNLVNLVIELHTPRQADLASAVKRIMPFADSLPNEIMDDLQKTQLNGTVSTFGEIEFSGLIPMKYAEVDTIGFRFTLLNVKIETVIS